MRAMAGGSNKERGYRDEGLGMWADCRGHSFGLPSDGSAVSTILIPVAGKTGELE